MYTVSTMHSRMCGRARRRIPIWAAADLIRQVHALRHLDLRCRAAMCPHLRRHGCDACAWRARAARASRAPPLTTRAGRQGTCTCMRKLHMCVGTPRVLMCMGLCGAPVCAGGVSPVTTCVWQTGWRVGTECSWAVPWDGSPAPRGARRASARAAPPAGRAVLERRCSAPRNGRPPGRTPAGRGIEGVRRKEVPRWCICRACLAGRGPAREPAVVSDRRPGRRSDRSSGQARHLQLIRHHLPDVLVGAAASPPRPVGWHAGADDEPDARGVEGAARVALPRR